MPLGGIEDSRDPSDRGQVIFATGTGAVPLFSVDGSVGVDCLAWIVLSGRLRVATLVVVFAMIGRDGVSRDRTWGDEATPQV